MIEQAVVNDPRVVYKYITLLRQNALGNFKQLVEEITVDPGMLFYLNGNQNVVGAPNENYARELLELFSIGKGPTIGEGNYTHYSEQDVLAAAKVLTGWIIRNNRNGAHRKQYTITSATILLTNSFLPPLTIRSLAINGQDEYKDLIKYDIRPSGKQRALSPVSYIAGLCIMS